MKVLFTAAPSIGHIAPMLGIATALQDAAHEVRLATHPSVEAVVRPAGIEVVPAGMSEAAMLAERRRRWPDTLDKPPGGWGVRMFAEILAPAMADDLAHTIARWRPDLVIHEEGEYAGPAVATRAGIPSVTHGWGSPLRPPEELVSLERSALALWEQQGLDVPPAAGLYRDGLLNPCPTFLQAGAPGAVTAWPIRPTHVGRSTVAPGPAVRRPIERHRVYVGFGTVAHFADAPTEIRAAVAAVVQHGLDAVVTTTNDLLRKDLATTHRSRVEVAPFVSLPDLLPTCRLVVCHGGAGTVLASLTAGVPLVLAPRGAPSQTRMTDACVAAGVAVGADADDIGQVVSDALTDNALSSRAETAAADIAAMPAPADVVAHLETIVTSRRS